MRVPRISKPTVAALLTAAATAALAAVATWQYKAHLPQPAVVTSAYARSIAADAGFGLVGSHNGAELFHEPPPNTPLPPHLWLHVKHFAPQPGAVGLFGFSVAIHGDRLAIGAPYGDPQLVNNGYVDLYERIGSNWTFVQKVVPTAFDIPPPLHPELMFGDQVLLRGDMLIVGARHFFDTAGRVFVFERNGGTFVQTQQLKPAVDVQESSFGGALALSGDTLAIGRGGAGGAGSGGGGMQQPYLAGEVHVYVRSNGQFVLQQILVAPDGKLSDHFGGGLDLQGDRLVVRGKSSVYLFQRQAGVWIATWQHATPNSGASQGAVLLRPGPSPLVQADLFVGEPNATLGRLPAAGRVLRFTASTSGPGYVANGALQDPQPVANGRFGSALAASGGLLQVTAPTSLSTDAPARVRVFERKSLQLAWPP
jgi:hypothetical protein